MRDVFDGPSGQFRDPGDNSGKSYVERTSIADGPGGIGRDPTVSQPRWEQVEKQVEKMDVGQEQLTWEQRALRLLSSLEIAKGYKSLPAQLRAEVRALIDDAPDSAYS